MVTSTNPRRICDHMWCSHNPPAVPIAHDFRCMYHGRGRHRKANSGLPRFVFSADFGCCVSWTTKRCAFKVVGALLRSRLSFKSLKALLPMKKADASGRTQILLTR